MRMMTNATMAALVAAVSLGGIASAQTNAMGMQSNTAYSMLPPTPKETPEDIEKNAEEAVIIHFTGGVNYLSTLQLVVMVQDYYRRGYRRFVMPIQTPGGTVRSSMYAYETLSRMPIEITTVAIGPVDSAGIQLYCLGKKRYAMPGASFLFHPMQGMVDSNRRGQEAAERQVESLNVWNDSVEKACFGEKPEEWDLERRDYRATVEEASEMGLVNAGTDYFEDVEPVGEVSYVYPMYYSTYSPNR